MALKDRKKTSTSTGSSLRSRALSERKKTVTPITKPTSTAPMSVAPTTPSTPLMSKAPNYTPSTLSEERKAGLAKYGIVDRNEPMMSVAPTLGGPKLGFEFVSTKVAPITEASKALARDIPQEVKNKMRGGTFDETKMEIDHIIPVSLGGTKAEWNLQSLLSKSTKVSDRQQGKMAVEWDNIDKFQKGILTQGQAVYNILQYQQSDDKKKKAIETNAFKIAKQQLGDKLKSIFKKGDEYTVLNPNSDKPEYKPRYNILEKIFAPIAEAEVKTGVKQDFTDVFGYQPEKKMSEMNDWDKTIFAIRNIPAGLMRGTSNIATGAAGTMASGLGALEWAGVKKVKPIADKLDAWAQSVQVDNPAFADKLAQGLGSVLTFYIPGAGAMKGVEFLGKFSPKVAQIVGGSVTSLLEAATEAGDTYRESEKKGDPRDIAVNKANAVFALNTLLLGLTNRLPIITPEVRSSLGKVVMSMSMEGLQEYLQQIIQYTAQDKKIDLLDKDALEAGSIGFLLGSLSGASAFEPDSNVPIKIQRDFNNAVNQAISSQEGFAQIPGVKSEGLRILESGEKLTTFADEALQTSTVLPEKVTVFHGTDNPNKSTINRGDFITLDRAYAENRYGKVISEKVSPKELMIPTEATAETIDEYIFNPIRLPQAVAQNQEGFAKIPEIKIDEFGGGIKPFNVIRTEDNLEKKPIPVPQAKFQTKQSQDGKLTIEDLDIAERYVDNVGLGKKVSEEDDRAARFIAERLGINIEQKNSVVARELGAKLQEIAKDNVRPVFEKNVPIKKLATPIKNQFITSKQAEAEYKSFAFVKELNLPIVFKEKILTPQGKEAFGSYRESITQFIKNPHASTPSHEAVHAFIDLVYTEEEKTSILEEVKKRSDKPMSDLQAEEKLANDFFKYRQAKVNQQSMPSLSIRLRQFFAKLWESMKTIVGVQDKIARFYKEVETRKPTATQKKSLAERKKNRKDVDSAQRTKFQEVLKKAGLTMKDVIRKLDDINLKRDVNIRDIYGVKSVIKAGEALTPYELKGNKYILQDGKTYIIQKGQFDNVMAAAIKQEAKEFAPELKQTEETVKGASKWQGDELFDNGERLADVYEDNGKWHYRTDFVEESPAFKTRKEAMENAEADALGIYSGNETKYSQYQLPGGKNYKEILIKAPVEPVGTFEQFLKDFRKRFPKNVQSDSEIKSVWQKGLTVPKNGSYSSVGGGFKSSHWDEPNVLAHLRLNERTYNGKKVTFMEELQSDWAREGRTKGFDQKPQNPESLLPDGWQVITDNGDTFYVIDKDGNKVEDKLATGGSVIAYGGSKDVAIGKAIGEPKLLGDFKPGVPNNPLLKNWQELSLKRALLEAVNNNSDYLAWINGDQTSARYDLATYVNNVKWDSAYGEGSGQGSKRINIITKDNNKSQTIVINKVGEIKEGQTAWKGKKLDEVLGKGLAEKIIAESSGTLSGDGLKFGGEWANNLYDKQVKVILEKITGAKAVVLDMGLPIEGKAQVKWAYVKPSIDGQYKTLTPDALKVGLEINGGNSGDYIITDILGDGKFRAVPKDGGIKLITENGDLGLVAEGYLKKINIDGEDYRYKPARVQDFDISTKTTQQQAIKITPEIKALVEGKPVDIKKASGALPLPKFQTVDDVLEAEARKYKSAEEFIKKMQGSATQYGSYTPNVRLGGLEGYENISKLGVNPDETITIYRGIDDINGNLPRVINDGDFVTTDFDSAASYAGSPKDVVSMEVKAKDLYVSEPDGFKEEPFYIGAEYIYTKKGGSPMTKSQLTDIWNKANTMYQLVDDVFPPDIVSEFFTEEKKLEVKPKKKSVPIKQQLAEREKAIADRKEAQEKKKSLAFYQEEFESQYARFKKLNAKGTAEDMEQLRKKNKQITGEEFDSIFYSQELSGDEVMQLFVERYSKERQPLPKVPKETKGIVAEKARQQVKSAKEILDRRRALITAIKKQFDLSDADLKRVNRRDIRFMDNFEFKNFLDKLRVRAENYAQKKQIVNQINAQIQYKWLKNYDNLRRVMKLPPIDKMSIDELQRFDEALTPFQEGDEFLSVRKLQVLDRTRLQGVKTMREVREHLAKELGLTPEQTQNIKVGVLDRMLWDTALAQKNPLYKMMVEETAARNYISEKEYLDIEKNALGLAKNLDTSLVNKLIPQQKNIVAWFEAKDKSTVKLSDAEQKLVDYMISEWTKARDYLVRIEAMNKGINNENYFTHVRRTTLEAIKEDGFIQAFKEIFKQYKLDEQNFTILDQKTGEVLAMDKFIRFAMHRTGNIKPSENVVGAFLTYMKTFKKKQALDELVPVVDMYAQALAPKYRTKTGLAQDDKIIRFVKEWLNNKKGRRVSPFSAQGDKLDLGLRAIKTFTTLLDLGLSLPTGVAATVGEQVTTYRELGKRKYIKGVIRTKTPQGRRIIQKYRNFVGKSVWGELVEPAKSIDKRFMESLFVLFRNSSVEANKITLLGSMTDQEWQAEEISARRLAELRTEIGGSRVVENSTSVWGATPEVKILTQYKTWALPVIDSTIYDIKQLSNLLKKDQTVSPKSIQRLYRTAELLGFVLILGLLIDTADDDSFIGKLKSKAYRELSTLFQALNPKLYLSTPRSIAFLNDIGAALESLRKLEEYQTTKEGSYEEGDLKAINRFKMLLTPQSIKQFQGGFNQLPEEDKKMTPAEKRDKAESKLEEIEKSANPAEEFKKLLIEDEELADKVAKLKEEKNLGITDADRKLKSLGVKNGERAQAIFEELNKLETTEEKSKLWNDYTKKKIISKEVASQLKELLKNN